jgi:integration host factor subunit beta
MIKADLTNKISQELNIPKQEAEEGVNLFFETIREAILRGEEIEIRGFGSFRTRQRQPRIGRNPKTGARVEVPAKKIPYFKPSKELKDVVNNSAGVPAAAPPAPEQVPNPQ